MYPLSLKQLTLVNFKNIHAATHDLDEKINCFIGNNGVGKSNTLDAIYHLAIGKSYFSVVNDQNINHQAAFMMIEGLFDKMGKKIHIQCTLKRNGEKKLKRNGKTYDKLADHVGTIPIVIISPTDRDLILEGSVIRRKFFDSLISQSNTVYLQQLIDYQRILIQRNALLKHFSKTKSFDQETLHIYSHQLDQLGTSIYKARKEAVIQFIPLFSKRYEQISNQKEEVTIEYVSNLHHRSMRTLLKESLPKDRVVQYTTKGIHRDDLLFCIGDYPIKKYGSQGQQKSFLIALKLAQYDMIRSQGDITPILILDDIFDKLDDQRVGQIIALVNDPEFGQIFISDTHYHRTEKVIKTTGQTYKMFSI